MLRFKFVVLCHNVWLVAIPETRMIDNCRRLRRSGVDLAIKALEKLIDSERF
ncbi:MAG: hypothetical protein WAK89_13930 [Candidatus Sulfotelmatobacter sp.]